MFKQVAELYGFGYLIVHENPRAASGTTFALEISTRNSQLQLCICSSMGATNCKRLEKGSSSFAWCSLPNWVLPKSEGQIRGVLGV